MHVFKEFMDSLSSTWYKIVHKSSWCVKVAVIHLYRSRLEHEMILSKLINFGLCKIGKWVQIFIFVHLSYELFFHCWWNRWFPHPVWFGKAACSLLSTHFARRKSIIVCSSHCLCLELHIQMESGRNSSLGTDNNTFIYPSTLNGVSK